MNSSPAENETEISSEFAAIAAEAAQIEAETAPPVTDEQGETQAEEVTPLDYNQESRDLLDFSLAALAPLYPCLEKVYTPDKVEKLAGAMARVMEKYQFSGFAFLTAYAPEIGLVIVAGPLLRDTVKAIREEKKAAQVDAPSDTPMAPKVDTTDQSSLHTKA